jgi:PhnB protein
MVTPCRAGSSCGERQVDARIVWAEPIPRGPQFEKQVAGLVTGPVDAVDRPPGWPSVTPRIVTDDAQGLVGFLQQTFGATGAIEADRPAVMRIGDSVILISAVGPRPAAPAFLYVYVDDADATYRRALDAGAAGLEEPLDTPYGDRRGMVQDPWGNVWQIATLTRAG